MVSFEKPLLSSRSTEGPRKLRASNTRDMPCINAARDVT